MLELAKAPFLGLYKYSGVMAAQERLSSWTGNCFLPILLFHRVTDEIPPDGLTVSTAWFRDLCRMLQRRFHVVSLTEAMDLIEGAQRWPRRVVAITFDDCYKDNLFAARVLAEHKLPACFFVPTAYPGTDHVFPWDVGLQRMANLTWDDIKEMVGLGHEIGSHTVHHVNMAQVSIDEARRELQEAKETLERRTGRPTQWFAYPFGGRDNFLAERLALVREAGYRGCFSGFGGFATSAMKDQIIPREPVPCFQSHLKLELHLAGCLDWMYAFKRRLGLT